MTQVNLAYVQRKADGIAPRSVSFYASLSPIETSGDNILHFLKNRVQTDKTPRKILEELEAIVKEKVKESPSEADILYGNFRDNEPKYSHMDRLIGYLAHGFWPKIDENKEEGEKRKVEAREETDKRNKKLLEIYQKYVSSF